MYVFKFAYFVVALASVFSSFIPQCCRAQKIEWIRQLGSTTPQNRSSLTDKSYAVSTDEMGHVYISGVTYGDLKGTYAGAGDAFISKYDVAGDLLWSKNMGTGTFDQSLGVSADAEGNVYIAGSTLGSLGGIHLGGYDAFVSKFDGEGNLHWSRLIGTSADDYGSAVSVDKLGNVYVTGASRGDLASPNLGDFDAFLAKFDSTGSLLWSRQQGTGHWDHSLSVTADAHDNVFIAGYTYKYRNQEQETDTFVSSYDSSGNLQWTRNLGTAALDRATGISSDDQGNVYFTGYTSGNLGQQNAGGNDPFLGKYDAEGNLEWVRQFGTESSDRAFSVSADGLGNVYLAGSTYGNIDGPNSGSLDLFVVKYDSTGVWQWAEKFGTAELDEAQGISADGLGNVYVTGFTEGELGGPHFRREDAFLIRIRDESIPEPSSILLILFGSFTLCARFNRLWP